MEPLTITVSQAAQSLSIGVTKLYELIGEGKIESVKVGRRRLIKTDSIRRLVGVEKVAA